MNALKCALCDFAFSSVILCTNTNKLLFLFKIFVNKAILRYIFPGGASLTFNALSDLCIQMETVPLKTALIQLRTGSIVTVKIVPGPFVAQPNNKCPKCHRKSFNHFIET